jgi:MSHA biogenesis protein MshG
VKEMVLLRFLKAFDIMVNNNVPLLQALAVLDEGTTNLCLKEIITEMRKDISKGLPLAGVLTSNKDIMTPLVAYTISMGEKAGNLGVSLTRIGDFVDKEINYSMKKLSSRLDPIMTIGLGIMALFIALAIYLPIFDMMKFKA